MRHLANIFWLGTKELRSFAHDYVLIGLIVYAFSVAIYAQSRSTALEVHNAAIAIADEDHSTLSRAIARVFLPPYFKPPLQISPGDIDRLMDTARFTFVLDIPPDFERDVMAGHQPAIQVNVDATAAMLAGIGAGYIQQILSTEIARFAAGREPSAPSPVNLVIRVKYNPNVTTSWFMSVMGIVNFVTMLSIVLAGAAIVREREHGTMDHLMAMPLAPFEIAMAKVWANGLVITVAVALSLTLVVRGLLQIPIAGSVLLFLCGVMLYLFFTTAVGVLIGTIARSMPQLGLLFMLIAMPMNLLSGAQTPLESMPPLLQTFMQASPSTHFVSFAQSILFRDAGLGVVWPQFLATGAVGAVILGLALLRFRTVAAATVT